jgi:hypothetical protein
MEDLLLGGICWCANLAGIDHVGHVLDVVEHDISGLAIELVILSSSYGCDVR